MKKIFKRTSGIRFWTLRLSLVYLSFFHFPSLTAQSVPQPYPADYYHWMQRSAILHPALSGTLHQSIKPIRRSDIYGLALKLDSLGLWTTDVEDFWLQKVFEENNDWYQNREDQQSQAPASTYRDSVGIFRTGVRTPESSQPVRNTTSRRPFLNKFYRTRAHFFELDKPGIQLKVNPLLRFSLAKESDDDDLVFWNQRGISIRGKIDHKVYFHTSILESQARYPSYVRAFTDKFNAVPRAGFFKNFSSSLFDFEGGVDFLLAKGFVGMNISKHINVEFGHGRHFIGNGIRSLLLSDFATDHFYLKFNTRVWKLHYQNIFGELIESKRRNSGDVLLPKKYFAAHYLSFKVNSQFSVGLFETVVFARENQFELQYLNPIILYRTVEGAIGSPDNVLIGLNAEWNIARQLGLYAQFILDEFKLGELGGSGWWGNKFGLQLGGRYINAFNVDHLDLQLEYNAVRPYTYSHNDPTSNFSHYNQSLAHPLGANFREMVFRLRYQPKPALVLEVHGMFARTGEDQDSSNYGSNVLLVNTTRERDFDNEIGQGVATQIALAGLDVSWEIRRNLYLDFFYQYRDQQSDLPERTTSRSYIGGGIRMNLGKIWHEF